MAIVRGSKITDGQEIWHFYLPCYPSIFVCSVPYFNLNLGAVRVGVLIYRIENTLLMIASIIFSHFLIVGREARCRSYFFISYQKLWNILFCLDPCCATSLKASMSLLFLPMSSTTSALIWIYRNVEALLLCSALHGKHNLNSSTIELMCHAINCKGTIFYCGPNVTLLCNVLLSLSFVLSHWTSSIHDVVKNLGRRPCMYIISISDIPQGTELSSSLSCGTSWQKHLQIIPFAVMSVAMYCKLCHMLIRFTEAVEEPLTYLGDAKALKCLSMCLFYSKYD